MTTHALFPLPRRLLHQLSATALWLLAAGHLLALMSLLMILLMYAPARAETACHGKNLLKGLQRDDPQAYAAVMAEGRDVVNGQGLFWKVEREGIAPSYLLGTMHVTDPRVLKMPPGAAEAHAAARVIVIESDEILDERRAAAAILARPELTMFTDGRSIENLLPPEDLVVLKEGLEERGLVLSAVSRMKPWMLAGFVATSACESARKAGGAIFLDKKIALDAMASGKPVKGLETLQEQLAAMAGMPIDFHLQALVETVRLGGRMDDVVETTTELYLAEETGVTIPALKALTPTLTEGDESAYAAFESAVISDRNHRMAERAAPILAEGGAFVAIGALHLPGEDGLVELLRKQGFTVSRSRKH
ncbi:GumN family protein [Pseudorhizobium banfieldiae]|uniref:GumN family protein n=2 Tax=Pseudorhizobium banfieldiae TaxID=1125847 RepID=L0NJG4_9HYPH|nr:GumN family protein [Pseudorhizobium banfieldiae]